jgi:hypothetical protein
MPVVRTLTLQDPHYLKRVARIVALYNESSPFSETLELRKPSTTRILCVDGDSGGLLLDRCTNDDSGEVFYRVMFAGFDPEHRRQGYLRACLDQAQQSDLDIRFIELNPFDDHTLWQKVGFPHIGTWGLTLVASQEKEPFLHYGVSMAPAPVDTLTDAPPGSPPPPEATHHETQKR